MHETAFKKRTFPNYSVTEKVVEINKIPKLPRQNIPYVCKLLTVCDLGFRTFTMRYLVIRLQI